MNKPIVVMGTLDTKSEETGYLVDAIRKRKELVLTLDCGMSGNVPWKPDVSRDEVAEAGGSSRNEVEKMDERVSIILMMKGVGEVVKGLYRSNKLAGVIGLGGSLGTALCTAAMRALPFGVPKLMVSTMASFNTRPFVRGTDIVMFHSVADIVGLNPITTRVLENAAGAIAGMVTSDHARITPKSLIAISTMSTCIASAFNAKKYLEKKGSEAVVFHSVGSGGEALEDQVEKGLVAGVLDISLAEFVTPLLGGSIEPGPTRFRLEGEHQVPRVIAPGNAERFEFFGPVPRKLQGRNAHSHSPGFTSIQLNEDELHLVGRTLAERMNKAAMPVAVIIPKRGVSIWHKEGGILYDEKTIPVFTRGLKEKLNPGINVVEVDAHINDPVFAEKGVDLLYDSMSS